MKGFIELIFENKVSYYIRIKHVSVIENRNGVAFLSLLNGDEINTSRDFNEVIKQIKEKSE